MLSSPPIGCPVDCGRWPDCDHGIPLEPPLAHTQAVALAAFARDMSGAIEAIETHDPRTSRGMQLFALVDRLLNCEMLLGRLRAYAVRKQYETMESELPKGYLPLSDPAIRRRGGVER